MKNKISSYRVKTLTESNVSEIHQKNTFNRRYVCFCSCITRVFKKTEGTVCIKNTWTAGSMRISWGQDRQENTWQHHSTIVMCFTHFGNVPLQLINTREPKCLLREEDIMNEHSVDSSFSKSTDCTWKIGVTRLFSPCWCRRWQTSCIWG